MELIVRTHDGPAPGALPIEVVERKGLGHPDTICDAIAEHFCVRLCHLYRERFGVILHHNVDKVLLCGGAARPAFGGGEILEPIELHMAGRVTREYRGETVPLDELAVDACREWLGEFLPHLDAERHVRIITHFRPGSGDLIRLFAGDPGSAGPRANDTSCGAGFAPFTDLERVVLAVEQRLNSAETKQQHPEIGADVKVMGVRQGSRIVLTVGCAFVDRFIKDPGDYARKKAGATALALEAAQQATGLDVRVGMNVADDVERGDVFLTVSGTSAEAGDDGEVGRGNRTSGLITPYRPMTLEAAAGKNPVSHVGKLYNILAGRIATMIATEIEEVIDTSCLLVSQIGRPVHDPQVADVRVVGDGRGRPAEDFSGVVGQIVHDQMSTLVTLRDELLEERVTIY